MEPADRLAAFLAGELSADERQAVEAALVRDPGLRAQLDAMRRADAALAGEAPTALPDGARARLLHALQPALDAELGRAAPATDELAARRTGRRTDAARTSTRRTWMTAIGGVAAAGIAVAVLGPTLGGLGGSGDSAGTDVAMQAEEESASDGGEAADDTGAAIAPIGPTLLGSDRSIDEESAAELLAAGELDAVVDQGLTPDDALALGSAWAMAFGVDADDVATLSEQGEPSAAEDGARPADDGATADDGEATEDASAAPEPESGADSDEDLARSSAEAEDLQAVPAPGAARDFGRADAQILGQVDDAAREDVARCLDTVLEAGGILVPALAELVTFDGEPAVAFGLVGVARDDTVTRREVWVLDRQTCEVRHFASG